MVMDIYWNIWSMKRGPFLCKKVKRNMILEDEFHVFFICFYALLVYYIRKAVFGVLFWR